MRAPLFGQLILASFVILVSLSGVVCAQAEQQSFSVRVNVFVKAENESVKSKIVSYVNRELRSLGDVVVTDNEPQYRLSIIAQEVFASGTPTGGIALSTTLTIPLKGAIPWRTLRPVFRTLSLDFLFFESLEDTVVLVSHWVQAGGTENLRSLCEDLVARIDSTYFEAGRKDWQTSQDELSKEKQ